MWQVKWQQEGWNVTIDVYEDSYEIAGMGSSWRARLSSAKQVLFQGLQQGS